MKQLIILSLLVPMLCFANESEPMPLEAEVATKLDELRLVQRAVESTRATQVEENTESSTFVKTYGFGVIAFAIIGTAMSLVLLFRMGWRCLRFNYHYYIEYGDYRLGWGLDNGERTQVKHILNKLGYDATAANDGNTDYIETSWFGFLTLWIVGTAFMAGAAIVWPFTLIMLGPNLLTEAVAYRKRKKKIFELKLKGEMNNGSV